MGALLTELKKVRRERIWMQRIISWGIVAVILAFGYLNYVAVRCFDGEAMKGHLEKKVRARSEFFSSVASDLAQTVGPVYYTEIQRAIPEMTPVAEARLRQQWRVFQREMKQSIDEHMLRSRNMLLKKREVLLTAIPDLKDEAEMKKVMERFERRLKRDLTEVVAKTFDEHIVVLAEIDESVKAIGMQAPAEVYQQDAMVLLGVCLEIVGSRLAGTVDAETNGEGTR